MGGIYGRYKQRFYYLVFFVLTSHVLLISGNVYGSSFVRLTSGENIFSNLSPILNAKLNQTLSLRRLYQV